MIRNTSSGKNRDSVIPANTREVSPELRKQFGGDKIRALFGTEYAMNEHVRIFVRHVRQVFTPEECVSVTNAQKLGAVPKRDSPTFCFRSRHSVPDFRIPPLRGWVLSRSIRYLSVDK